MVDQNNGGRPPAQAERLKFQQENWYALSAIDGYDAKFDPARQSLDLRFAPTAFLTTRLADEEQALPPVSGAEPAAFFNYDLSWSHSRMHGVRPSRELGALTEAGVTGAFGVLTSSFLGRHVQGAETGASAQWRRLETTFVRDFPEHKLSLRLGDTTSRTGLIGRPFYFGGIQIARNFDLAPGFISQPLPLFAGSSSVPSTVELYINDALRQTLNVPAGPFTIENPMPISGDGRARMVVRDALGRETRDYAGRFFCPRCGSSVYGRSGDEIEVNLGTLDAPDQFVPTYELWTVRRESWLPPFPLARRYERDEEETGRPEA